MTCSGQRTAGSLRLQTVLISGHCPWTESGNLSVTCALQHGRKAPYFLLTGNGSLTNPTKQDDQRFTSAVFLWSPEEYGRFQRAEVKSRSGVVTERNFSI